MSDESEAGTVETWTAADSGPSTPPDYPGGDNPNRSPGIGDVVVSKSNPDVVIGLVYWNDGHGGVGVKRRGNTRTTVPASELSIAPKVLADEWKADNERLTADVERGNG